MKRGPRKTKSIPHNKKSKQDLHFDSFSLPLDQEQRFLNAVASGDIETFNQLVYSVNLNCTNFLNETALMLAIAYAPYPSKLHIVTYLIDLGVDIDVVSLWSDTALSYAKHYELQDIVVQLQSRSLSHIRLPSELWVEIAKYLGPEDLENFRLVCHSLGHLHNQNEDLLWQPLLNRLHAIDKTIKIIPPPGKTIREAFIAGFFHIQQDQRLQLNYMSGIPFLDTISIRAYFSQNKAVTLDFLEERHKKLVSLNCTVIQKCIDEQPGDTLNLDESNITMFPEQMLEGKNKPYFANLKILKLARNDLLKLPDNIDFCENLEELNCRENSIVKLPESISKLRKLRELQCQSNLLTELPERIEEFVNLTILDCENNDITHLPSNIGALTHLRTLSIGSNPLNSLPESIIYILNSLVAFDFRGTTFDLTDKRENSTGAYYVSFIDAKKSSTDVTLSRTLHNNDLTFWEPLAESLRIIHPSFRLIPNTYESLRDQFIECFKVIAKTQLTMLSQLLDPHLLINYHIVRNPITDQLSFKHLTLGKMIRNHEQIIQMLSSKQIALISEQNNKINEESPGLFFQLETSLNSNWLNAEQHFFDFDEPEGTIRWRW